MNTKNVIMGVVAGATAGAALGILFAPYKGKSTRRRILAKKEIFKAEFEDILNGYVDMIHKKMESLKLEITNMSTNGKANVDDAMTDVINAKIK